MTRNQKAVIGPNQAATLAVPNCCWHGEEGDQDQRLSGTTYGLEGGGHPLQALNRREHRDGRRDEHVAVEQRSTDHAENDGDASAVAESALASVTSERVPPSPLLSARRTMTTYLTATMMISAHRMRDTNPDHLAGESAGAGVPVAAARLSFSA